MSETIPGNHGRLIIPVPSVTTGEELRHIIACVPPEVEVEVIIEDNQTEPEILYFSDYPLLINLGARTVQLSEARLEITKLEFDILACLAKKPDTAVPRQEIFSSVWNIDPVLMRGSRTIDEHVSKLRRTISSVSDLEQEAAIFSVRGVGYGFNSKPYLRSL